MTAAQLEAEIEHAIGRGKWFRWRETGVERRHNPMQTLMVDDRLYRRQVAHLFEYMLPERRP